MELVDENWSSEATIQTIAEQMSPGAATGAGSLQRGTWPIDSSVTRVRHWPFCQWRVVCPASILHSILGEPHCGPDTISDRSAIIWRTTQ